MEILSKSEITTPRNSMVAALIIVLLIVILVLMCCLFTLGNLKMGLLFIVIAIIAIPVIGYFAERIPTGKHEYKVLINEDYLFIDFYNKYEVAGRDGKIWILHDKDDEIMGDTEEDEYGCYGDNDDSEFEDEEFE